MNLYKLPDKMPIEELVETIIPDNGVLIERIISAGQVTPPDVWYDQDRDEWVVLLQGNAKLSWANGKVIEMGRGDWVFIAAHDRHRVEYTSQEPPCIWLAVHGKLK